MYIKMVCFHSVLFPYTFAMLTQFSLVVERSMRTAVVLFCFSVDRLHQLVHLLGLGYDITLS